MKKMVGITGFNLNSELSEYIGVINTAMALGAQQDTPPNQPRKWRLRDKLSERDTVRLAMAFETGIATKELAQRYGINIKSVRKVLREHGVTTWR